MFSKPIVVRTDLATLMVHALPCIEMYALGNAYTWMNVTRRLFVVRFGESVVCSKCKCRYVQKILEGVA